MARSKWHLAFGTMIIPIKTAKISKEADLPFKEFHTVCGNRLGRKTWCNTCNVEVPATEKGKGIVQFNSQEQPIPFSKDELENLHPMDVAPATIIIKGFVDPLPFKWLNGVHRSIKPQDKNPNFVLALQAFFHGLQRTKKVAMVKYWDSNKSYNAVINGNGIMSEIFWNEEVDTEENEYAGGVVDKALVDTVAKMIRSNVTEFTPETQLVNAYRDNVIQRANEKQEKGVFTFVPEQAEPATPKVADVFSMFNSNIYNAVEEPVKVKAKKKA